MILVITNHISSSTSMKTILIYEKKCTAKRPRAKRFKREKKPLFSREFGFDNNIIISRRVNGNL